MTELADKNISCSWRTDGVECSQPFTWTAGEQEFYAARGYRQPRYCREHRELRKKAQDSPFGEALRQVQRSEAQRRPSDKELFG